MVSEQTHSGIQDESLTEKKNRVKLEERARTEDRILNSAASKLAQKILNTNTVRVDFTDGRQV